MTECDHEVQLIGMTLLNIAAGSDQVPDVIKNKVIGISNEGASVTKCIVTHKTIDMFITSDL